MGFLKCRQKTELCKVIIIIKTKVKYLYTLPKSPIKIINLKLFKTKIYQRKKSLTINNKRQAKRQKYYI